jgi:pimeloyl-ACP methyl ester carboxylesterase
MGLVGLYLRGLTGEQALRGLGFAHNARMFSSAFPKRQLRALALVASIPLVSATFGLLAPALAAPQAFPVPDAATSDAATDPFYAKPSSAELSAAAPGTILRIREIKPKAFFAFDVDAKAWQLMFRSTDGRGQPVASITTVLVPPHAPAKGRVLLSYQVAYDALTLQCAPSQSAIRGRALEQPQISSALSRGWVVSLPDYEGLDSLWGAAVNSGQGVLDAVRAAQRFEPLGLDGVNTKVGLLGYSGGALASTWAAELHPTYAPELNIVGVAAGGVPVDIGNVARKVDGGMFSGLYLTMVMSLSKAYPEINPEALVNNKGRELMKRAPSACVGQFMTGATETLWTYPFKRMGDYVKVPDLLALPVVKRIIDENRLGQRTPKVPHYVYQATLDQVMSMDDLSQWVGGLCKAGVKVQKHTFLAGHLIGLPWGFLGARDYIADRFEGKPVPSNCP